MQTRHSMILLLALTLPRIASAQAECTALRSARPALGESIAIVPEPKIPRRWVEQAIALWRSCPDYGRDFPSLLGDTTGTRRVEVRYRQRSGTRRCGSFQGSTITLYKAATSNSGRVLPCRFPARTLAHELGHALGLKDASRSRTCDSLIMAQNDPRKPWREVSAEECQAVGSKWLTPAELSAPTASTPMQAQNRHAQAGREEFAGSG